MKLRYSLIAAILALAYAGSVLGAVSAEEANKLGTTLTSVGAEKAGNKDGSIPAYTGGLTTAPAGFKKSSGIRPDPFAGEKPLYSITAANMVRYADKLTEGNKVLLKKNPTYRIDVYKTHRTVALPNHIIAATGKNALTAKTSNGGVSVTGAKGGFPFPIPNDGYEVMWNHLLAYRGEANQYSATAWNVDSAGHKTLSSSAKLTNDYPYNYKNNPSTDTYFKIRVDYNAPSRRSGESMMFVDYLDIVSKERKAWQYLPGQRRVKLAPSIAFDTPNPATAGVATYDDAFIFNGSMERFKFKLIGKKEIIVPYNDYKYLYHTKSDVALMPRFVNPDALRWELHRVWVVEATLMPGKRHIYSKRVFYVDEDSWIGLASDQYDARGTLYRCAFNALTPSYDVLAPFSDSTIMYDLIAGSYNIQIHLGDGGYLHYTTPHSEKEWSPDSMAGAGIR